MKLNDKKNTLGASSDIGIATINKYLHHGWVVIVIIIKI